MIAFAFVAVTQLPNAITKDNVGLGAMFFKCWTGPLLAGETLVFAVVPSILLVWTGGQQRRDRVSLCISASTLGLILLAWLLVEPLRQAVILGW